MIGIDIENIARFSNLFEKKKRLLEKMFHKSEWKYAMTKANPPQTLTGIWCAKEATLKALYSSKEVFIKDVVVKHKVTGEPYVVVNCSEVNSDFINISISHAKDYATSVAILLK